MMAVIVCSGHAFGKVFNQELDHQQQIFCEYLQELAGQSQRRDHLDNRIPAAAAAQESDANSLH
jgi:hypothetical protein